ncbi:hypothetical protein BH10ACT8_BH10ACT8_18360 [soil metagenome]
MPSRSGRSWLSRLLALGLVPAVVVPLTLLSGLTADAAPPTTKAPAATFGIGPASAKKLDGRQLLNYLASPGARLTDHVAVVNIAATPVTLNLYTADAANGADGSIGYRAKAAARTDANWIVLDTPTGKPSVTVPARSTLIIPITLAVPERATPGDHALGVIVSLTSKVNGASGQRVDFEQRVALRTYIRVSGALRPSLAIEGLSASYHGTLNPFGTGTVSVHYRLRNNGNIKLGGRQSLSVTGLFGRSGTVGALADVPLLLPGSSVLVEARVSQVRPGFSMHAKVKVSPLKLPSDVNPPTRDALASAQFWAVPWSTLVGLLILLLGLAVAAWWLRRRRSRPGGGARHSPGSTHDQPAPGPQKVNA